MIRRILLTLAASALTLVGAAPAAFATTYSACDGVWVVVDYGSLGGGVSTKCAATFSTGTGALRGAGFTPTLSNGFLEKINGKPASPNRMTNYWSYWHATRNSDGSYGSWQYSNSGANSYYPTKGNAEGWHYVSASGTANPPGATPPNNPVAGAAAPAPAKPPAPAKAPASTAPKAGAASDPAAPASSASRTASAKASTDPAAPNSATPPTTSTDASPASSEAAPSAPTAAPPTSDPGSPVPVVATGAAVLLAGAGAGGWWWWKGRQR